MILSIIVYLNHEEIKLEIILKEVLYAVSKLQILNEFLEK